MIVFASIHVSPHRVLARRNFAGFDTDDAVLLRASTTTARAPMGYTLHRLPTIYEDSAHGPRASTSPLQRYYARAPSPDLLQRSPTTGETALAKSYAFVLETFAVVSIELLKHMALRLAVASAALVLLVCLRAAAIL
ncbi:hypothetical protein SPRG_05321 [Saprolegnia parasitica CBS 223.65]|uniref:Uncharacterized protein n=1 Tax=Saprolegnia parasitica (strain CBS 223.65) TaxID=695850 RepID=A0A067CHB6_SAPPC|nr:hypothetical protein SPRG_05321 [Saprolegnia parasitica CBS 223.65]KDO30129.1 hypothetical protein SPRG_05321 [Saprolegnia parasitica CBS 223.65]|eukprot:XP_012199307.1 hypothetical protein SPRG_05321 [Saprolegnia parasitica CBS 223.65]